VPQTGGAEDVRLHLNQVCEAVRRPRLVYFEPRVLCRSNLVVGDRFVLYRNEHPLRAGFNPTGNSETGLLFLYSAYSAAQANVQTLFRPAFCGLSVFA
jgi:hypothetical protein